MIRKEAVGVVGGLDLGDAVAVVAGARPDNSSSYYPIY
jgi:hypothetical protein